MSVKGKKQYLYSVNKAKEVNKGIIKGIIKGILKGI